ncbi:Pentatricopeptide repeat-containing protein [Abeliophyllum distichum]|uniref:Pentatricopeptide repeat-containing protein n=1 Tax=Abeliophyllum distichum TaxID=126358 RepID=A0ABD1U0Q0_9LAMI
MAIRNSPDWPLSSVDVNLRVTKNIAIPPHIIPLKPRTWVVCSKSLVVKSFSSGCSSPVLEDATTNAAPVIEVGLKLQRDFHVPDSGELNAVICSLFGDSQTEQLAYDYYEKAKAKPNFTPQKSTLNLLVRYLIGSKNWASLFSFCEDVKKFKVLPSSSMCCRLINVCIKARKLKLINILLQVFLVDAEIAVLAFDSAMKGYNSLHMYSSTIVLYEGMKCAGIVLDPSCYCHTMEACLKMGHYERALTIFQEFANGKYELVPSKVYTKIYYIRCTSLGKLDRCFEALEVFREMKKRGVPEDHSIYSSLISCFASVGKVKIAEELLEEAECKKMLRDPALFLKLVLMYVEVGQLERTVDIVSVMKRVNIRVSDCIFCSIVNAFSKRKGLKAAAQVYEHLTSGGCEAGQVTYASVQNIYFRLGLYSKAELLFSEMVQKGYDKCVVAYSSMVSMYSKTGRPRDAMRIVAKMKERGCEPNVWIYNSLLDMHGRALNLKQVEKIWKEMKRRKVFPDRVTYTSVISAYSRAREFEMCTKLFDEFKIKGGVIDRAMAGIMVAVFSKMNRVDELVKLLQDMKMEGTKLDARLYRSAMNALSDAGLSVENILGGGYTTDDCKSRLLIH